MSERRTYFVDIILPLALSNEFTYRVPFELNEQIQPFVRVVVPFGKGKLHTGIVTRIHEEVPELYQAKYIEHILDEYPIITAAQYKLWRWIAAYYLAPLGDVMNAALPANFKLASETKIVLHPDFDEATTSLDDREFLIVEALSVQEVLTLKDIAEIAGIKTIMPVIKKMIDRRIVLSQEDLMIRFTPKTALFVELRPEYAEDESLNSLLNRLSEKKTTEKQEKALMILLQQGGYEAGKTKPILRRQLEDLGASVSALQTLEKNGVIDISLREISRLTGISQSKEQFPVLSDHQTEALERIRESWKSKDTVLLEGITGSGKTEIYIHLIRQAVDAGKQILFLVPEIALTTQLIDRLAAYFGPLVGVYHSRFNANERIEIWNKVLNNDPSQFRIIVGARSSVFLPFSDLGLVIVDEEHENSFKQHDPSPRYHGRDTALVLAAMFRCKTLLGSATPSIESWYNAREGKYGLAKLTERFSQVKMPEICCADMKKERREKTVNGHFSQFLINEMKAALERNEQIILFQNRRGYTPLWQCEVCTYTPGCVNCDTSLTYHKQTNSLKCHHCSYQTAPIGSCPACGSNRMRMLGFGTEKVEDDLQLLLPELRIARMDYDTTRNKNSYQQLISDFSSGSVDVLIGTQMVAKGLDFDRVGLVGILDADQMITKTDFRAFERAFQLISQVSGRAGRRERRGKVVIQTANPEHWVIQKVMEHDFESFAVNEIVERRNFHYPPFYRLIYFTLKHKDVNLLNQGAAEFSAMLRTVFFERVDGPEFPPIARVQNVYQKEIRLKIEQSANHQKIKERLKELINQFFSIPQYKSIRINPDVDPF